MASGCTAADSISELEWDSVFVSKILTSSFINRLFEMLFQLHAGPKTPKNGFLQYPGETSWRKMVRRHRHTPYQIF